MTSLIILRKDFKWMEKNYTPQGENFHEYVQNGL